MIWADKLLRLILLACVAAMPEVPGAALGQVTSETQPGTQYFPNYGMSVVKPGAGWVLEACPPANTVARWTRRDDQGEAEMLIRWETPTAVLKESLAATAAKEGGVVLEQPLDIQGLSAAGVRKESRDDRGVPALRYECDRGPIRFIFVLQAMKGTLPERELLDLCKAVRWTTPERVTQGEIAWAPEPAVLLGGEITAQFPVGFHQEKVNKEFDGLSQWTGVLNLGTGTTEVVISFKSQDLKLHKPAGMNLAKAPPMEFKNNFTSGFERMINAHAAVESYVLANPQKGVITEMAEGRLGNGAGIFSRAARLYDERHMLQVQVIVLTKEAEEVKKWDKVTEKIIESIQFAPPAPPTPPTAIPGATPRGAAGSSTPGRAR